MSGTPVRKEVQCQLLRPIHRDYLTIVLRSVNGSSMHFSHGDSTYIKGKNSQSTVSRGWIVGETGHGCRLRVTEFVEFSGPDEAGWEPVIRLDSRGCLRRPRPLRSFVSCSYVRRIVRLFWVCFLHTEPGPWRILGSVVRLAPHTNRCATRGKRRSSSRSSLVC